MDAKMKLFNVRVLVPPEGKERKSRVWHFLGMGATPEEAIDAARHTASLGHLIDDPRAKVKAYERLDSGIYLFHTTTTATELPESE